MTGNEARLLLRDSGLPGWEEFEVSTDGRSGLKALRRMADAHNKMDPRSPAVAEAITVLRKEKYAAGATEDDDGPG